MATEEVEPKTTEQEPEATDETPAEETKESEVKEPEGIDWRQEARKWESRSKENFTKVTEYEAQIGELSKKAEKAEEAEELFAKVQTLSTELSAAKLDSARYKAAMTNGLSVDDIEFITGTTEEEIESSASKFAERVGAKTGPPRITVRTQGQPGTEATPVLSVRDSLAQRISLAGQQ